MTRSLPEQIQADSRFAQRRGDYALARRYYRGEHAIMDTRRGRARDYAPRNYIELFVDTMAAHIGTARARWGDSDADNEVETYVADVLQASGAEQWDYDGEVACSVDGDGAWKVTWDDQLGSPRVAVVDAGRLWVRPRPGEPTTVDLVADSYDLEAEDFPVLYGDRVTLSRRGAVGITEAWTPEYWEIWEGNELKLHEPNPYAGLMPYVVYPNSRAPGRWWGQSDVLRLKRLQDELNRATSDFDEVMRIAGTIVVFEGGVDTKDLRVEPGSFWSLPEEARASVLDVLSGNASEQRLRHIGDVRQAMHDIGRVPPAAFGEYTGDPSGVALELALGLLLRQVYRKRLARTAAHRQRAQLIATLGARYGGLRYDGRVPSIVWSEVLPRNRGEELKNAGLELELGRSHDAVLRGIGVDDPAAELRARAAEDRALGGSDGRARGPAAGGG